MKFQAEQSSLSSGSGFSVEPGDAAGIAGGAVANSSILEDAKRILDMEAQAIAALRDRLAHTFEEAIELLLNCQGKVVVTGMGKSGHIGCKIAATFASTGTPSFFVHPAELRHGDIGMLDERDLVIALSGSGETQEIKQVLEPLKRLGVKIIALTGGLDSTLARFSDVVLDVAVEREACPFNLAPTSSTTATLAMGDALAVVLMQRKKFSAEDFARSHPGGALGQRLVQVKDIMRQGVMVPVVALDTDYPSVLNEIDKKRLGFTAVINRERKLVGVITDGDLRRRQVQSGVSVFQKEASEIMTANPKVISPDALAVDALRVMEKSAIDTLLIVDAENRPIGIIDVQDLLHAGII